MPKPTDTSTVKYHPPKSRYSKPGLTSISPLGIDTEADVNGRMFMTCLSTGLVITPVQWPAIMFSRKYRDRQYCAYNLRYDMGALIQHLPEEQLTELRETNKTEYNDYKYKIITNKLLSISRGKHYITIYDIMQFYGGSLSHNAKKYLQDDKIPLETKSFTDDYIRDNWDLIAEYCIHDAKLTELLAQRFIDQLNIWGLTVTKLYSTAWISYSWFSSRCGHPSVKHFWLSDRRVLDYAMRSYNGGKFEVTTKGPGYLYEYDIVSAYPTSIANLYDLYHCGVKWSTKYVSDAVYAFVDITAWIPPELPNPIAIKRNGLNTYPCGLIRKTITKQELDYFIANNVDLTIHSGCWIIPDKEQYIYRDEVNHIVEIKQDMKHTDELGYHTAKILMNSLYGKFVQLVEQANGMWRAGSSWNPIYASVITAETRVRISDMQRQYPSIRAVHTDSLISDQKLPFVESNKLGDMSYEIEGNGVIVGCGMYEIADKTALRGVKSGVRYRDITHFTGRYADLSSYQPISWRQALQRHMELDMINRWIKQQKRLDVRMDRKRIWIDDWDNWTEIDKRTVESVPLIYRYDRGWIEQQ